MERHGWWRAVLLLLSVVQLPGAVVAPEALPAALANARPGDEIVVAAGRYTDVVLRLIGNGRSDAPVVIRAESPGAVAFTGSTEIRLTGHDLVWTGFVFDEARRGTGDIQRGVLAIETGQNIRVTNNRFMSCQRNTHHYIGVLTVRYGSVECRIDHCDFVDSHGMSIRVYSDGPHPCTGHRIDHNQFVDIPSVGTAYPGQTNGLEAVQLGAEARFEDRDLRCTVENNLFLRYRGDGAEIISVKTSSNTIRDNVFLDCRGGLVLRHGHRCRVEGNYMARCDQGVRVQGSEHAVVRNMFVACERGLLIGNGDATGNFYNPARNGLIVDNWLANCGTAFELGYNQQWHDGHPVTPAAMRITGNQVLLEDGVLIAGVAIEDLLWTDNRVAWTNSSTAMSLPEGFVVSP